MEAHSFSSDSSESSSIHFSTQYTKESNKGVNKIPNSFHSSLHSVRKPQVKPWKKPIAPLPPTPPKVYRVDPINFRELVQKLTGAAPESQSQQRLQTLAPPPLDLDGPTALFGRDRNKNITAPLQQLLPSPAKTPFSAFCQELMSETMAQKTNGLEGSLMAPSSLELNNNSPSSYSWCAFPLLSPGTLSSLEQSTVL